LSHRHIHVVKPEIRILGVDDGIFIPHSSGKALVVGIVFRGGYWLDGVMHTYVAIDGFDATEKISTMVTSSPHHRQLRVIMLNGITFAGFNVVNIQSLSMKTDLPVIAVTSEKPDLASIREAIENLSGTEDRWQSILAAGEGFGVFTRNPQESVFLHVAGLPIDEATQIVRLSSTRGKIPEALRVAHLIASGVSHS
jgi:endonuclease V-like protein UPF0215 family